jgi:hypothetical protein
MCWKFWSKTLKHFWLYVCMCILNFFLQKSWKFKIRKIVFSKLKAFNLPKQNFKFWIFLQEIKFFEWKCVFSWNVSYFMLNFRIPRPFYKVGLSVECPQPLLHEELSIHYPGIKPNTFRVAIALTAEPFRPPKAFDYKFHQFSSDGK